VSPKLEAEIERASPAAAATDPEQKNYGIPVVERLPVSGFGG
jgi:hypothetical protein